MNNNRLTTWAIIVLLIIAGSVYVIARSHENMPAPSTTTTSTDTSIPAIIVTDYYCQEGNITASYQGGTTANLTLSDGRSLALTQGVSGSGVRYASADGTIVWDTEGNNGFLQENGTNTYNNCIAGTETASGNSFTYTDPSNLFSFTYPNTGSLSAEMGYSQDWKYGASTSGIQLAEVTIPGSVQPKTNLGDSRFTVGTSSDPAAIKSCLTENPGGSSKGTLVTINGVQFTKFTASDAGAGNLYNTTSYRTMKNGQCYAVEYTIHSSQIGNYPPSAGISAYDKTAITNLFEGMVQSFKFNQ